MRRILHGNSTWTSHVRAYAAQQWARPAVAEFCAHVREPFHASVMP